jgi:type II secretory pathway component PulK
MRVGFNCVLANRNGVALVTVLLLVSLLSLLAVSIIGLARHQSQSAIQRFKLVQMNEVLDSALRLQLLELAYPPDGSPIILTAGQRAKQWSVLSYTVDVSMELEACRVDLNHASVALLKAVFIEAGVDTPQELAERIADWRDADDIAGEYGAERGFYEQHGVGGRPRNAHFESVNELRQVWGAANLPDSVLGLFTVYSQLRVPEESCFIPTIRGAVAAAHSAERQQAQDSEQDPEDERQPTHNPILELTSVAGQIFRFKACHVGASAHACRITIVRFTGSGDRPYMTYVWQTEFFAFDGNLFNDAQ